MGYGFVIPDFQRHFSSFFTKEKKELDIECLPRFLIKFLDIFYPAMIRRVHVCNKNPTFYIVASCGFKFVI